ncbi:MAG: diphosphate--fructose-6-phosphate 1-phosphotransferase [Sphaerochaetaceae bacterium]|nr:diphosphate--fructose-6-phosphate 1-phosphotransferase [Sphaerochaetaceae bacterium]
MVSPLQRCRYEYQPKLPGILVGDINTVVPVLGGKTTSVADAEELKKLFPNTFGMPKVSFKKGKNEEISNIMNVGVVLSGGQAPGGHNVIAGLFDALKKANTNNRLYGFKGGPSGLTDDNYVEITAEFLAEYRNTGGFDIIGSGRTKLESEVQFEKCIKVCQKHDISGIVIIGGDDSNTNAAVLAEYFKAKKSPVKVVGCPKTIDGDLKNESIEVSFGFDTATKTYSELIGNIARDSNSARKYWHFIRLMGRSASHIALECALQTQPNICIIGEEVEKNKTSLSEIIDSIVKVVVSRGNKGLNFGVCLVPEGLVEFIPEFRALLAELNDILAKNEKEFNTCTNLKMQYDFVMKKASKTSCELFSLLPEGIQGQLLADRDPHGNVQVSKIETEKLLIELVDKKLDELTKTKEFNGKFMALSHFFGYEGRCAAPSNFDSDYCYSLGYNAVLLLSSGLTGYISSISNLSKGAENWKAGGIPITMMMNMEMRNGKNKPVIKKALVELEGKPFKYFEKNRAKWAEETCFLFPGAIQYFGPSEVCDLVNKTLTLEQE